MSLDLGQGRAVVLFWIILGCVVLLALAALIGGPRPFPDKRTERSVLEQQLREGPPTGQWFDGSNGGS